MDPLAVPEPLEEPLGDETEDVDPLAVPEPVEDVDDIDGKID